jgi:protein gp37
MAQNTKIEWCHHTANLWHGCTKVHEGCDNCYAEAVAHRWGNDIWGNDKPRKEIKSVWNDLDRYQKLAEKAGEMHRVFINSMSDFFEKAMPLVDSKGAPITDSDTGSLRGRLFYKIDSGQFPNLILLFLTKRPSNINKMIPDSWKNNPPKNVMFGTSPVNQETAKTLITQLSKVNGRKFLSVEPQLDHVDITNKALLNAYSFPTAYENGRGIEWTDPGDKYIGIDWVIQGGESGPKRRPFDLAWAYSLKKQCEEAGNRPAYFFKQIDKVIPIPDDLMVREFPAYHSDVNYFLINKT